MLCPFRDYYDVLAPIAHLMGPDIEALCERRRPMIVVYHYPCIVLSALRRQQEALVAQTAAPKSGGLVASANCILL